ncbi:eukaryotic cytochrome b561-domain-containing protein [Absidia repens]|uniref:Eukaryotic cytochrome b561-domain-containing protein n=1 Tax=Absidia repens TaxID=90262 RepID=A0A1X2IBA1_9FUNG|nr:eukaryotic cytochrome b561-domain-containing protein [Absidia repens]
MPLDIDERTHLLNSDDSEGQILTTAVTSDKEHRKERDSKGSLLIRLVLMLLAVVILSVLARIPLSVFSLHPFFMTIFVILLTEGIATLQPTHTKNEKHQGLKRHAIIQIVAFLLGLLGFSAIFYNKVISNKSHFTSGHGKLGVSVILYLIAQFLFGLVCAYIPGLAPAVKKLWKYHRLTGYIFLSLVWINVILGLQADYIVDNSWLIPSSFLLSNWSFLVVVFIILGVALRIRPYKLKGQVQFSH